MYLKKYLLAFVCLLLLFRLYSQSTGFIFHNTGERQGLSANHSYKILRDGKGFMWIATVNGLSRYDGAHFYNFRAGLGKTSFINNEIMDLCEDKQHNIWGATSSGLFRYNITTNSFENYSPPTLDFARRILNIICDKRGDIWATSEWNIFKFNKNKNSFDEIGPLTRHTDSLRLYSVRENGLIEDPSGNGLWFATRAGLHFYDIKANRFDSYKNKPANSIFANHSVAALSVAPGGYIWYFDNTAGMIISFNPATQQVLRKIDISTIFPGLYGQTIFEDSHNKLWISTWNNTMAVIDYQKNSVVPIAYKNENPLSVAGDNFSGAWEDEDNNIWLATAGGISKCNYSKNVYSILPIVDQVPEFKGAQLGALSLSPDGKSWWIAAERNISVIEYFPESGKYEHYDFTTATKNCMGQLPGPVYKVGFMDGQPYAMTHTGIWRLDKKTKAITPFEMEFENWPHIHSNFFVEHGDDLWFTTVGQHIKWNKKTNRAIKIKSKIDSLPDGQKMNYGAPFFDQSGRPWFVPAFGWLAYITEKNEVVLKYYIKDKPRELSGYLTSMTEDKHKNLWMAGFGIGLYKYNIDKEEMTLYGQANGISSFTGQASLDKDGKLWLVALNKFSVFDPLTKSTSHYNLPLYENTRDYSSVLLSDSSGGLLATLYKDIVQIMPDRLSLKPVMKSILLSRIKIGGKEKLIAEDAALYLEPDENSLEFSFGSLINDQIFPYEFQYQLSGFDKDWITTDASATALYSNLSPGKYTFKVRVVAKDRSWQTAEKIMSLSIRTPFYKAIWFCVLIAGLAIAALILFYRYRLHQKQQVLQLENKTQALEKEKAMVMYENLKQQLNPHFLFNSLSSLSGLIDTDQQMAGDFLEHMSGIYRYILQNSERETVALKDELAFVKIYLQLQQTRFSKGLQVNINVPEEFHHYKIAPVTLQNMIENAMKHNVIDSASPLVIDIYIEGEEYIVVKNNLQRKKLVETSNKRGLPQFVSLYKYLSKLPVRIEEDETSFKISIPLI